MFSKELNARCMYKEFKGFEEIEEIVTLAKRDIRGRKYGLCDTSTSNI